MGIKKLTPIPRLGCRAMIGWALDTRKLGARTGYRVRQGRLSIVKTTKTTTTTPTFSVSSSSLWKTIWSNGSEDFLRVREHSTLNHLLLIDFRMCFTIRSKPSKFWPIQLFPRTAFKKLNKTYLISITKISVDGSRYEASASARE